MSKNSEIIEFFKNGNYCKEFEHEYNYSTGWTEKPITITMGDRTIDLSERETTSNHGTCKYCGRRIYYDFHLKDWQVEWPGNGFED